MQRRRFLAGAALITPERLANTDPFQPIKEIVGSGPFLFLAHERAVGSRVSYAKSRTYVPRPNGRVLERPADLTRT
jgi:peptide/nickel transport system substrate-binding protein